MTVDQSENSLSGKRLLFVSTGFSKGGAETQLFRLAVELSSREWTVGLYSLNGTRMDGADLESHGIEFFKGDVSSNGILGAVRSIGSLSRLIADWRPDVVVSFMYHANIVSRIAASFQGVPAVASIRNESFGGPFREFLEHSTSRLGAATVVNSELALESLVSRGVLQPETSLSIPNAASPALLNLVPEVSKRSHEGLHWLAVGRLSPQKDYPNLIAAFSRLSSLAPASRLSIAGEGKERHRIENEISRRGVSESVTLLGHRSDIPDLLQQADALVLSSSWEGMPNVVMEALAAGKPVVATDVGGVRELVLNGINGFISPPRSPERLFSAMKELTRLAPSMRHRLGIAGRIHIEGRYSLPRIASSWEDLLLSAVLQPKAPELSRIGRLG